MDDPLFLTLADTGLRPGEALALKWDDVDLADRSLRIERALSRCDVKATKTGEARTVDVTSRLAGARSMAGAGAGTGRRSATSGALEPPEWVFPSEARTPLDEINVGRRFGVDHVEGEAPAVSPVRPPAPFATHLLAESAPITYVAAQLGHAKPTTTLAFYAHWLPRGDKSLIDRLESARHAVKAPVAQGCRKKSEPIEESIASG